MYSSEEGYPEDRWRRDGKFLNSAEGGATVLGDVKKFFFEFFFSNSGLSLQYTKKNPGLFNIYISVIVWSSCLQTITACFVDNE